MNILKWLFFGLGRLMYKLFSTKEISHIKTVIVKFSLSLVIDPRRGKLCIRYFILFFLFLE